MLHRIRRALLALLLSLAALATAATAASAAPELAVSVGSALNPNGVTVTVSGTGFEQSYTPAAGPPSPTPGFYIAQGAIVSGTVVTGTAKWINPGASSETATQAPLAPSGDFSASLALSGTLDEGAVDCRVADCLVIAWPAHSNPVDGALIEATEPLAFGPPLWLSKSTDLDPAGETVTVSGDDFEQSYPPAPGSGAPLPQPGFYVAQAAVRGGAIVTGASKWINPAAPSETAGQAPLSPSGAFSASIALTGTLDGGAVDCGVTDCQVIAWPAHSNPVDGHLIVTQDIAFGEPDSGPGPGPGPDPGPGPGGIGLAATPSSNLSTTAPTTVTVQGVGYSPTAPGIYVVFGPQSGNTNPGAYGDSKWLSLGTGLSATGTFATTLTVRPTYTDASGNVVNCTVVQCYVSTMRAHGMADVDQSASVPLAFGSVVSTPKPDEGGAGGGSGPVVPAPPAASASERETTAPALDTVRVRRNGRASLRVSEPSTVTFTVRRRVKRRWKVVRTVTVEAKAAGTVSARLGMKRAGRYRISISAVGRSGTRSSTHVRTVKVAKRAKSTKKAKGKRGKRDRR